MLSAGEACRGRFLSKQSKRLDIRKAGMKGGWGLGKKPKQNSRKVKGQKKTSGEKRGHAPAKEN